jgi:AbrB family looped-hinge helix DNA binding protein
MPLVFAIYGIVDVILLFAATLAERAKPSLHALGIFRNWKYASPTEETPEKIRRLGEFGMRSTKTNAKGQVTIPAELRDRLGINKGTRINWQEERGQLVLTPITAQRLNQLMCILKPPPGKPSTFDELFAERERERKREDLKYALLAGIKSETIEIPVAEIRERGLVAALRKRTRRK